MRWKFWKRKEQSNLLADLPSLMQMDSRQAVTKATIDCILWSIEANGLERTLEELRGLKFSRKSSEMGELMPLVYKGMLAIANM